MKSKSLSFVLATLLVLAFSFAAVSASTTFAPTSISTTGVHGSTVTVTFNLSTTDDTYSNLAWSNGTTSTGSWNSLPTLSSITNATTSATLTGVFTIPQYTAAGTSITSSIVVKNGTTTIATLPVTISVNSSNGVSLSASSSSISKTQNSTITVTNTGNTVLSNLVLSSSGDFTANLSSTSISSLNPGSTSTFIVSSNALDSLTLGSSKVVTVKVNNSAAQATTPISAEASYCLYGDIGTNLSISDFEISKSGDDNIWKPLETVEVKFHVYNRNTNTDTSISTYAKMELYSSTGSKYLNLNKVSLGSIKGGDDKLVKFNFTVPVDIKVGTAYLYMKAYQNGNEAAICTSQVDSLYKKSITIDREDEDSKLVAITDLSFDSQPALCGTENIMRMTVVNVGNVKQDNIKISVYNKELGLSAYTVLSNLDEGDSSEISFPITIPSGAVAKTYSIDLKTRYNIRDDSDIDTSADTSYDYVRLTTPAMIVSGTQCSATNTSTGSSAASITAEFSSETPKAVVGQQVIVEATIKNTGATASTYSISVAGNSQWSTLATIDPQTFTINAGDSKKVGIYLNINSNSTVGSKEFTIKATSGSLSTEQKVQVNVEKGLTTDAIINHVKNNWFVYLIVVVNLILIIAIVLVVKSLMNKA